jgi:DNA replication protein DnaC
MTIFIKNRLELGEYNPEPYAISLNCIKSDFAGARLVKDYPIKCKRCEGNMAYLGKEGDENFIFCGSAECMLEDKIASIQKQKEGRMKRQALVETGAEKFHIGERFKNASLAMLSLTEENAKKVFEFFRNEKVFLVYSGPTQCGKTYLGAAILNHYYENRQEVYFLTQRRLMTTLQENFSSGKSDLKMFYLSHKEYLIIDEFGEGLNTDWQKDKLLELIDIRYSNNLKTIILTQMTREDVKTVFGNKLFYRIFGDQTEVIDKWKI